MTTRGIVADPDVMMGKPVVEGTRITVEQILEELGAGRTIEELLEADELERTSSLGFVMCSPTTTLLWMTSPRTPLPLWTSHGFGWSARRCLSGQTDEQSEPTHFVRGSTAGCCAQLHKVEGPWQ